MGQDISIILIHQGRCDISLFRGQIPVTGVLDVDIDVFAKQLRGILDAQRRELVLDRLLALDAEEITLEDVKWVVLMVLFNQPGQEANYAWMEDLMFDTEQEYRH